MERTTWILLAVAFVLGAAIGLFAGAGSGVFRDAEERLDLGPAAPDESKASAVLPASPGGAAPAPGTAKGGGEAAAEGVGPLTRALAEIEPEALPAGTGVISGTVRTSDGAPLPGVLVRATRAGADAGSSAWRNSGAPPREADLETELREWVQRRKSEKAGRREAVSGPDGAYAVQGLPEGTYTMAAFKEGWRISPGNRWAPVKPGATVDFTATALLEVPVDVLLPDGTRPAKARISVRQGPMRMPGRWNRQIESASGFDGRGTEWTPENSCLWLQAGTFTLVAEAGAEGKDAEFRSDPKELTVEEGTPVPTVVLQLQEAAGVRGKVTPPPGLEVDSLQVRLVLVPPGENPDPKALLQRAARAQASRSDGYSFSFRGLEPGRYQVGSGLGWSRVTASTVVEVADRMVVADLVLPPPDPRELVVVRGFGPNGDLLRDLQLAAVCRAQGGQVSGGGHTISQKEGVYRLLMETPESAANEPRGAKGERYFVSATTKKYGHKEEEFVPGRDAEVAVRFEEPATLEATIAGYAGSGLEGKLQLSLMAAGSGDDNTPPWHFGQDGGKRPNAAGVQTLGPVQPGAWEIQMQYFGEGEEEWFESSTLRRTPIRLGPGTTRTTVELPVLHSLTVWIEKGGENATVMINRQSEETRFGFMHRRKTAGKDGRATFERLPPGDYAVYVSGGSSNGQMNVTIPGPSVVRFEPEMKRAFQVTVTDPQGALAQAGFKTGDLIIGVEGTEFKSETHMQALLFAVLSKSEAKILLLREGRKVEIQTDPTKILGERANAGGWFQPAARKD